MAIALVIILIGLYAVANELTLAVAYRELRRHLDAMRQVDGQVDRFSHLR